MQVVGKLNNGKEHGYAAGLEISTYRGQPVVSHGGAWAGYRAELMRFPGQHTSVAVLCNVAQAMPTVRAYRVADVVLENVLSPTPASSGKQQIVASVSPAVLQSYAGIYKNEKDEYQRIEFKDGKLWLSSNGTELIPRSATVFGTNLGEGSISFSEKQMVMALNPEDPRKYALLNARAPKDLGQFTGDYYSAELDATWQLRVKDGQLIAQVKHSDAPSMTLQPVEPDTFTLEGGSLRFEIHGDAPKRAFLTVSRIRNVEFVKN
jgi:hypothetical protein